MVKHVALESRKMSTSQKAEQRVRVNTLHITYAMKNLKCVTKRMERLNYKKKEMELFSSFNL